MRICSQCSGTGKFKAYSANVGKGQRIEIPESKCCFCDGKGYIAAPQMEGCPPVIGGLKDA